MGPVSTDIFRIATECGLPLQPGEVAPVTDDAFLRFRERYLAWSAGRDAAVHKYLTEHPSLFRVLLPYSTRVLGLAMQIAWYADELITRDPLFGFLERLPRDIEKCKSDVVLTLQILSRCYEPIRAGYLLLYGSPLFPAAETVQDEFIQLSKVPEVRAALEGTARYGFSERIDERGARVRLYQVELDSGGMVGMRVENLPAGETRVLELRVGERLPEVSREVLLERIGNLGPIDTVFGRETRKVILAVKAATHLGAAVLFDRDAHSVIVQRAAVPLNESQQLATAQVLNVVVPYLAGVPPEHLYELRHAVPNAFVDFRGHVHGVVEQAIKDGVESAAEVKARVDREIAPAIQALDAEAEAEARRGRIIGYGAPAVVMSGLLVGSMAGLEPSSWLAITTAIGGLGGSVKAAADFEAAKRKHGAFPFYFLWKARRR